MDPPPGGVALTSGFHSPCTSTCWLSPTVFLALSRWGRNTVFDCAWIVFSQLLMGLLAAAFTFDMFAG